MATVGLMIFVAVIVLTVCGLLLDCVLLAVFGDYGTITDFCRRNHWAMLAVLSFELVGQTGLLIHFLL